MHKKLRWLGLQFFAGEGASSGGEGGDGGAAPGVSSDTGTAADAGQKDVLESMGVPRDKVEKYRAKRGAGPAPRPESVQDPQQAVPEPEQAAAAETEPRDFDAEWKKILSEPEFNRRMSDTVQNRVKNMKQTMDDLAPMLEVVGRKYGFDTSDLSKLDMKALSKAVSDDDSYYEDMASEMGVSREQAKALDQREREAKRKEEEANRTMQEQMLRDHYAKLQAQAAVLKQQIPEFDLERELQNEQFYRMTLPGGGLNVEQAYYALHHNEIMQARVSAAAQRTAQALSASIQSGRSMPAENGSVNRSSPPLKEKPYHAMNKAERAEWLRQAKSGKQFR